MESRLRLVIVDAGLPLPVSQHPVHSATGQFLGRVDFAWPEHLLGVEYDGDHHRERGQFRRDVGRLNALRMAGWTVLRFTADDVMRWPDETARTLVVALSDAERASRVSRRR
jgi:very-short-patch-repair endonuclease